MTARICRDCKRTKATDAEWMTLVAVGACDEPACVWGEDRCYLSTDCGIEPDSVLETRVEYAKQLRHGRVLSLVPHVHEGDHSTLLPQPTQLDLRSPDPELPRPVEADLRQHEQPTGLAMGAPQERELLAMPF